MEDISSILDSSATSKSVAVATTPDTREINVLAVKTKIAELNNALLTSHPTMPVLLREIHNHVRRDPELVTIISEEEIGIIVNGLKQHTQTVLVTTATKSTTTKAGKAAIAKLTADDL